MKRILITGAGSYIGTSFESWLEQPVYAGMYQVDTVDMHGNGWNDKDFSGYDAVLHVAGIVHQRECRKNAHLYDFVNRDLAIATARKAKSSGIKQFILMSSMSVYGMKNGRITGAVNPAPRTRYGKSKLQADIAISGMAGEGFCVAVVRPPMVYGKGCKGNYPLLSRAANTCRVFPDIKNERSMIYIGNLTEFIRRLIEEKQSGIFHPQNQEYVCTSEMVKRIAYYNGRPMVLFRTFNGLINRIPLDVIQKVFGSLTYDKTDLCNYISFEDSIRMSEREQERFACIKKEKR